MLARIIIIVILSAIIAAIAGNACYSVVDASINKHNASTTL